MNRRCRQLLATVVFMLAMAVSMTAAVFASDDNSLASLGITTPGVTVNPEFQYDIWEYSVEVPAGTKTLEMEPHTTNPSATVNSVTGTTLSDDGTGTVVITVTSESGNAIEYVLNVTTARGDVDPAEAIAANEGTNALTNDTEVVLQSEVETEDPRYVKVDRNSLEDAEKTIEKLQKTITEQRAHISMMTYVLYALIAVSIVFLFIVISQLLRRRDMAQELAIYRQGDPYHSGEGYVAEDGWGEWGEDENDRSRRKKKKKQAPADDEWDDEPVNASSSWVDEQVGTPMQPPRTAPKPYPAEANQKPSKKSRKSRQHKNGNGQYPNSQSRQGGNGQYPYPQSRQGGNGQYPYSQSRQGGNAQRQNASQHRGNNYDETRRYQAVQQTPPVHSDAVPKDVTKDLNRMNKAEAKAMKRAAAQEAKREQEARRAAKVREAEAQRQAQEAERLEKEQAAARAAQEEALKKAAAQRAQQEAEAGAKSSDTAAENDKNVKIDMIDL